MWWLRLAPIVFGFTAAHVADWLKTMVGYFKNGDNEGGSKPIMSMGVFMGLIAVAVLIFWQRGKK